MLRLHRAFQLLTIGTVAAMGAFAAHLSCQLLIPDSRDAQQLTRSGVTSVDKEITLGTAFLTGHGAVKDEKQAAYWFEKAAEAGDPRAQQQIGFLYEAGIGVPTDPVRAVHWYQLAAAAGLASAKTNLGVAYLWGTGVPEDQQLAAQFFQQAAGHGDGRAASYLGNLYYFGQGVKQDKSAAEHWYRVGAKLHDPIADFDLGELFSVEDHPHDLAKAAEWLRKSVAGGYIPAIHSLALLLEEHPEMARSDREYLSLFQQASAYGQWKSSVALGIVYRDGKLVPYDSKAAYYYFYLAALQGGKSPKLDYALRLLSTELGVGETAKLDSAARMWYQQHHDSVELLRSDRMRGIPPGLAIVTPVNGGHAGQLVAAPPS